MLEFINAHSSFIRDFNFPPEFECGVLGEPFACQGTGIIDHPCTASYIYLLEVKISYLEMIIKSIFSLPFECMQCNKSDRPHITITKHKIAVVHFHWQIQHRGRCLRIGMSSKRRWWRLNSFIASF